MTNLARPSVQTPDPARRHTIAAKCSPPTPQSIKEAVDAHFTEHSNEMEASIRTGVEDVELRILDRFCKAIQTRYVQRIVALEAAASRNREILREIRGHSERADDDLRRLADGINGLIAAPAKCR